MKVSDGKELEVSGGRDMCRFMTFADGLIYV